MAGVSSLTTVLALALTGDAYAQRSAPEGPWSGQAECVIVAKWDSYYDEQTHVWTLTGAAPTPAPRGSAQVYYTWPATWRVQGSGRKAFPSREAAATLPEPVESWTIASEMPATLRVTEIAGQTARVRIAADGQRGAPLGSIKVTEVSGRTRDGSVQPWPFPAIEDRASSVTISGTSTRIYPEGVGVGWGQPPKAVTTATCSWSFARGGIEQSSIGQSNAIPSGTGRGTRPIAIPPGTRTLTGANTSTPSATSAPGAAPMSASPADQSRAARTSGESGTSAGADTAPFAGSPGGGGVALAGPTVSCAMPGPDVEPAVTPASVRFAWRPFAGATGYVVADGNGNPLTPSPTAQLTYTHIAPHTYINSYSYSVTALLANGGCAITRLTFTPPPFLTPQVSVRVVAGTQPGRVTLTWGDQADVPAYYLVVGPGIPQSGAEVTASRNGQSYEIAQLPAGTHGWLVTPLWKAGDEVVGDASLGARVTATISLVSPRTIVLAGFTAAGTAVPIPPRTIQLTGFTAAGTGVVIPPRTITLTGWTSAGAAIQGVIR